MYILTDNNVFIGKDFYNHPIIVSSKDNALSFKTAVAARNYVKCVPELLKKYNWSVCNIDSDLSEDGMFIEYQVNVFHNFGNSTKATPLEDENFNICKFFEEVINVMAHIDKYIANMVNNEQRTDMKILDVRHYIRDNNHKLNAIQMQRLGYYLQDLEKERYEYKSKRIIASIFANDINAFKDKSNIDKMNDVLISKYRPRVLDDTDIEYIINKKKDVTFIA